mmetsp:Transcript_77775/g.225705  ORF Transcript_77775/g.225705 Transcript_77775/m.225705 type:complete len:308 (-) Transcript_77775:242-1165(-)
MVWPRWRVALLALLHAFPSGHAERLLLRSAIAPSVRRRTRSSGLVAATLLGVGAPPVPCAASERFHVLDVNGDGFLSSHEFCSKQADLLLFFQADLDDDGSLWPAEYEFACYLAHYETRERHFAEIADLLPDGFLRLIDMGLAVARVTAKNGGVDAMAVANALVPAVVEAGLDLNQATGNIVHRAFRVADVVQDELLNLNELDYFNFLIVDILTQIALLDRFEIESMIDGWRTAHVTGHLFWLWDANADSQLEFSEVLRGIADGHGEVVGSRFMRKLFKQADADCDGSLTPDELAEFLSRVLELLRN